jgi:HPt (histidine-containing phosphotransfer) domain-containing protein
MNIRQKAQELDLDENEYIELVRLFIDVAISDVRSLEHALQSGEADGAARAAHSLKGSAMNLCFREMQETAAKVEEAVEHGILEGLDDHLAALREELRRISDSAQRLP